MAGFGLRDSPEFDDWQFFQGETLRRELASALERLVEGHAAGGDMAEAIGFARRWLSLDPLHEPAHRSLMELYHRDGQRNLALRQYRACIRALDQELGVPPLEETTRLYEAIKENKLPQQLPQKATAYAGDPLSATLRAGRRAREHGEPPFVGRSAEMAELLDSYRSIGSGGLLIVFEGEPGIGKTRLAQEFLQRTGAGTSVIAARCYEGEAGLAFSAFVQALRAALEDPKLRERIDQVSDLWLSETSRLLPELATLRPGLVAPPPLDSPGAQVQFFEGVSQVVLAVAGGEPAGVLFFDDVHWADEASLDLLTFLTRRRLSGPICMLMTWRSGEIPNGHRLRRLLAESKSEDRAVSISLSRLSEADVGAMLAAAPSKQPPLRSGTAGDQPVKMERARRLYAETEGLPFFVVEYVKAMAKEPQEAPWSMPANVKDVLLARLSSVDTTALQLLGAAAVIGRSFDFDTVRETSGRSEEETVTALEALLNDGIVEEIGHGDRPGFLTYDFTHEQLRALVIEQTSLARGRLLHRRTADVLAARAQRGREVGPMASRVGQHYQRGGREAEAADHFMIAGEHAAGLYANAEALAHFEAALALGNPHRAALQEAIGDLQTLSGTYGPALTSYEAAASLCDPDRLWALEHKLGNVWQRVGEWELSESHFESALSALGNGGTAGMRARINADWSLTHHHRGQDEQATQLAQKALDLAEQADDDTALAQAHNILGVLARNEGRMDKSRVHLERSLELAGTFGDSAARVAAMNNLALAWAGSGETDRAIHLAEEALALCISEGDRHREAAILNNLADLFHGAGRTEDAMAKLEQAVKIFAEIGADAGAMQPEIWKLVEW